MIGNTNELNDPANYLNRNNHYPNANHKNNDISGIEPSIYDKTIYVLINSWFSMLNSSALPLICMQYDNLKIEFIFRPIVELLQLKILIIQLIIVIMLILEWIKIKKILLL